MVFRTSADTRQTDIQPFLATLQENRNGQNKVDLQLKGENAPLRQRKPLRLFLNIPETTFSKQNKRLVAKIVEYQPG